MTYSDYKKVFKQLRTKPLKLSKFMRHNAPKERSCGASKKKCSRCGRIGAHVGKYSLDYCRQCFREVAPSLGFKKYN